MNKILAIIFYLMTLNMAFAELAVLKAFSDGIALIFPEKNIIRIIPVPDIKKESIQLLNIEQNILTAKELVYGGSRVWYESLLFIDLKKHKILKFDPYKSALPGYTVVDTYHVKGDDWAVMLWKLPELAEYWILFDIEKQKIVAKNYHSEENFITYKKSDDLKKWENSWFFRKVITERFGNAKESIQNGDIVFSRYKNYLLVSDFKKMFLFYAGPGVAEKDEKFLYDLSGYLYIFNSDKNKSEFTRFLVSEALNLSDSL